MVRSVSISSKKAIRERADAYWEINKIWLEKGNIDEDNFKIRAFLEKEYEIIPEKERIGKGSVYITTAVANTNLKFLIGRSELKIFPLIINVFELGESLGNNHLRNYAIALMGEFSLSSKKNLIKALSQAKIWADHPLWEIREMSGYIIRKGLINNPDLVLFTLKAWIKSNNDNLRRVSVESLRPLSDIKWLRDPEKNDPILDILSGLRADSSVYVRKSVGNNLKDLTRYMPLKVLELLETWIRDAEIIVTDDLASKSKKELGENRFYLLWTIKHALRWIRTRNPEFHDRIEKIMGRNYVLYFDEKKNRLAVKK